MMGQRLTKGEQKVVNRLQLIIFGVIAAAFMWQLSMPTVVEAGSVRAPMNEFEREARDKCTTDGGNLVYGASWANNVSGAAATRINASSTATTVNAGMYSSAYLCSGSGTRTNIRGVNIESKNSRLSFSGTSIFRDSSASSGQFTTIPSSQPLGITINISGLDTGRHAFRYRIQYQDNRGLGVAADRFLIVDLVRPDPVRVTGQRKNGAGLTQAQVNGSTVRVRNTGYNKADTTGDTFNFTDVPAGSIRVTTSAPSDWEVRYRFRLCNNNNTSSCDAWRNWTSWAAGGYADMTRNRSPGQVLRVQFEYRLPQPVKVTATRIAISPLTQAQVNARNVRVRNDDAGYNKAQSGSTTSTFTDVPAGSLRIATSAPGGSGWEIRQQHRMCSTHSSSSCGSWGNWSDWGVEYSHLLPSRPAGSGIEVRFQYRSPSPPAESTANVNCTTAGGSINLDYTGTATARFKAWLSGASEPGWQQSTTFGNRPPTSRSYSFTVPNTSSVKDAYSTTRIRVRHEYSPRSEYNHDAFNGTVGPCGRYFEYTPFLPAISNNSPKPGQSISISPSVTNCNGTRCDTGLNYNYKLHITKGASLLDGYSGNSAVAVDTTRPGISKGGTDSLGGTTRTFTIKDDATHNGEVCFRTEINPTQGHVWPLPSYLRPGVTQVKFSPTRCVSVYNLQFELSDIGISGDTDYVTPGPSGTTLTIGVRVENNGDVNSPPPVINNSGAEGGRSSGVTTELRVYRNNSLVSTRIFTGQIDYGATGRTFNYNHHIPSSDSEDTVYCFIARSNPTAGWSDGSNYRGAPFNDSPDPIRTSENVSDCNNEVRVTTGPYFQVHRNDIASGVTFASNSNPLNGCSPLSPTTRGFISGTRTGSGASDFGSFVEYGAYALSVIKGFGTSVGVGTDVSAPRFYAVRPGNNSLAFANTPSLGELGGNTYRCMSNLYHMLDKGNALSGSFSNVRLNNINPPGAGKDVQVYANSNITITDGMISPDRRVTLIVNGDVNINTDIGTSNATSWNSNIVVISRGNIRIRNSVRDIDAMLYAIPAGAGTGVIDTCSNETTHLGTDVCGNQLTFHGIVVADRLDLKRTHGGVSGGRIKEPAEVFRFSPSMYVRPPYFRFSDTAPRAGLHIQQMIDLPPLF